MTKILVVGDVMEDIHTYAKIQPGRLSPEAPIPILEIETVDHSLGGAGNVFRILFKLGFDVELFSMGKVVAKICKDPHDYKFEENYISTKHRIIVSSQHFARLDDDVLVQHDPFGNVPWLDLRPYDAIILSDYNKGFMAYFLDVFRTKLQDYKGLIVANLKHTFVGYDVANIIIMNDAEHSRIGDVLTGQTLFVTRGGADTLVRDDPSKTGVLVPVTTATPRDVSGAGDAFVAGVTIAKLVGASDEKAASMGSKWAGIVIQKIGVADIERDEVQVIDN